MSMRPLTSICGWLAVALALSACLPQATRPAGPGGTEVWDTASGTSSAGDVTPPPVAGDTASNQPGPGGSMPSGTLAPHPLVPVNLEYKAEGTYCRFEGDATRALIRGRIYRREWGGSPDAETEFGACGDYCRDKHLQLFYQYQQSDASQTVTLDESADFQFVVDIDDPKAFGLILILQMPVAIIGQESQPPPKGYLINVGSMQPYTVEGAPASCPSRILMKNTIEARPQIGPPPPEPIESYKLMPRY